MDNTFETFEKEWQKLFDDIKVDFNPQVVLVLTLLRYRNVSVSKFRDCYDTPDPQFRLKFPSAKIKGMNDVMVTQVHQDETSGELNEIFQIPLLPKDTFLVEIELYDVDELFDDLIGTISFDAIKIPRDEIVSKTFQFDSKGELDVQILKSKRTSPDFRHNLGLHNKERLYRRKRLPKVHRALTNLLDIKHAPKSIAETPVISLVGSGGGYRAVTGMCGAMEALKDAGLLDVITYFCGLSGSAWYISSAYALKGAKGDQQNEFHEGLRKRMENNVYKELINPFTLSMFKNYLKSTKKKFHQPYTMVDYFPGFLIGKELFGEKHLDLTLSDMEVYVQDGDVPLPLMVSLLVKSKKSAAAFSAYIEHSPFETNIPSYGIGVSPENFGSAWCAGYLVKKQPEVPLHFIVGITGCAFAILLNQYAKYGGEIQKELVEFIDKERIKGRFRHERPLTSDNLSASCADEVRSPVANAASSASLTGSAMASSDIHSHVVEELRIIAKDLGASKLFTERKGRTGLIFNIALSLTSIQRRNLNPLKKIDHSIGEQQKEMLGAVGRENLKKTIPIHKKTISVADAGIWKNVPTDIVLRPQRTSDLLIVMDFTAYESDSNFNYNPLLAASTHALQTGLKFPYIDFEEVANLPPKEFRIFPSREYDCPTVIWFTLCNKKFKSLSDYKPRSTEKPRGENKKFNDFPVHDKGTNYGTLNFQYENYHFDQLRELMYYNVSSHIEEIKMELVNAIKRKRQRLETMVFST
ncbi:unnamed protein product [Clavelina lepadiformis]|uniref:phospholipase A2 n=1 Tax=Clavelina lepadiformis TaxID=159417 RepID=A0ABP0G2L0_CLALP